MSHLLKNVWIETSQERGLYCEKCEKVYAEEEVRAGTCPTILSYNCNMCTESLIEDESRDVYGAEIKFSTGFYSTSFQDGFYYRFRLCEGCIRKLFADFELPPERKAYISQEPGDHRWHFDPTPYGDDDDEGTTH